MSQVKIGPKIKTESLQGGSLSVSGDGRRDSFPRINVRIEGG